MGTFPKLYRNEFEYREHVASAVLHVVSVPTRAGSQVPEGQNGAIRKIENCERLIAVQGSHVCIRGDNDRMFGYISYSYRQGHQFMGA
jgi:hypothetical protein